MTFRRILIVVLLLAASGLAVFALRPPTPQTAPQVVAAPAPPRPVTVRVVTAARPLTPGMLLNETDITLAEVPAPAAPDVLEVGPAGAVEFRGSLVRRSVARGVPLTREDVMQPGERGFLAAVLKPGHRAISIGVDAVTGASGLVTPGDVVDLVLVQSFSEAPIARRVIAETVLSGLRVIAVDQQVAQGAAAGAQGRVARTVTVEVTPEGAERVAVAQQLGRLAVTVRAADDTPEELRPGPPVFGGDVSNVLGSTTVPIPTRMLIFQGGESREVTFR